MSCKDCDAYCINAGEEDAVSCEGYIPKPQTNADRNMRILSTNRTNSAICGEKRTKGGRAMSERQEKKKRYNLRLMWIADFDKWLNKEPPMWRVFAWRRWKRARPVWTEVNNDRRRICLPTD